MSRNAAKTAPAKMAKEKFYDHVACADNQEFMADLPNGCCHLIYVDPPFMTNAVRHNGGHLAYDDRWPGGIRQYLDYLMPRLESMHRLLNTRGTLYVHVDQRVSHYLKVQLDLLFGPENYLNEIVWHYRTGGVSKRWFGRKHDTILVYAKSAGKHTFHVQRSGTFRTDGLNYDEEGRPYKSTRKGRLYFNADGPVVTDVWDIPFLSTVSLERTGYPSQKPLALLERIIQASSNPGDLVADFFCGSGTTVVAAKKLGRSYLGIDSSKEAVAITKKRLKKAE